MKHNLDKDRGRELKSLRAHLVDQIEHEAALTEALEVTIDQLEGELRAEGCDPSHAHLRLQGLLGKHGLGPSADDPEVRVPATVVVISDESDRPGFNLSDVARAGRFVMRGLLEKWRGPLSHLQPVPMPVAEGTLAGVVQKQPKFLGFQAPLEEIFDRDTLNSELAWSKGFLRVMCALSDDGRIDSLKGSVGRSDSTVGSPSSIVLGLSDSHGTTETIELGLRKSSMVVDSTTLKGDLTDIELVVSLHRIA